MKLYELQSKRQIERLGHPRFCYGNYYIYIRDNGTFDVQCENRSLQTSNLKEAEQYLLDFINKEGKFATKESQLHTTIAVFHTKMQEIYGKSLPNPKLALILYYDSLMKGEV